MMELEDWVLDEFWVDWADPDLAFIHKKCHGHQEFSLNGTVNGTIATVHLKCTKCAKEVPKALQMLRLAKKHKGITL